MRVARAFRLPIIAAMAALALSGCMHATGPVAMAQPQSDLDSLAYGPAPAGASLAVIRCRGFRRRHQRASPCLCRGAASRLLRAGSRGLCGRAGAAPAAYDDAYRLDAGDKLRVVVYGQEGLTNTYAIDAGGSITMPLIGAVPARGRTPAGLAAEIIGQTAQRLYPRSLGGGGDRILPAVLHPRRSRGPRPISLRAQYERRERGGDRRRLLAARPARPRHPDPHRQLPARCAWWCRSAPRSAPAIPCWSANAGSDEVRRHSGTRFLAWTRNLEISDVQLHIVVRADARPGMTATTVTSDAWRKIPCCAARRCRRWPCRSSRVRRSGSRAGRRDRRGSRHRAAWP